MAKVSVFGIIILGGLIYARGESLSAMTERLHPFLAFGGIGLLDDLLSQIRHRSLGLLPYQKIVLSVFVALILFFSFLFLLALRAGPSAAETAFYHPEDIRQLSQVFMAAQDRAARGADQTQAQLEAAGPVLVELDRDGTLVGGRAQPEFIQYAQDVRKQATGSFLRIQAFVDVFTDDFQATFEAAVERALPEVGAGLQVEQCKATGIHALLGHSQCEGQDLNAALAARLDEDPVLRAQVEEILAILTQQAVDDLIDRDKVVRRAIERVENTGIVFLDELDKIASRGSEHGPDVSRQGVQRDLLPLLEGTTVRTRHGTVRTDNILFIAAGAFSQAKPSDLMPELQGRLPIRVELHPLSEEHFRRILVEPEDALTKQYQALLATEGVEVEFTPEAVAEVARVAAALNRTLEDIGARRLITVMERLMEELSFDADRHAGERFVIDREYVVARLAGLAGDLELSRYIL